MTAQREGKPMTPAEIAAENERIEKLLEGSETPQVHKPTRAETLAALMNRTAQFKPVPAPHVPVVIQEEKPDCPKCHGAGWYTEPHPIGHPLFGKTQLCDEPGCPGVQRNEYKRIMSQKEIIRRHFGGAEYYDYASMNRYNEDDTRLPIKCARLFLRDGSISGKDAVKRSIVYYGKAGTGKTFLISAIHNELVQRGIPAVFLKVRTMLKGVQRGYNDDAELRDFQAENLLRTTPYLFIDELEIGLSTDRVDIFESIIDYRCLHDLPTIIATNLEQDELSRTWNHRIQSRLIHMAWWVAMDGKTRRDTSGGMTD